MLAIDDAHALDEASAALAHQLVTQDGVRVLATVRRGEDVPDAIVGLWKDGLCERLDLEPLTRDALDQLVVEALGGPVDGQLPTPPVEPHPGQRPVRPRAPGRRGRERHPRPSAAASGR